MISNLNLLVYLCSIPICPYQEEETRTSLSATSTQEAAESNEDASVFVLLDYTAHVFILSTQDVFSSPFTSILALLWMLSRTLICF